MRKGEESCFPIQTRKLNIPESMSIPPFASGEATPSQPAPTADHADALILAHVSDIHFRKKIPGTEIYVPDDDLRYEMKRDLVAMTKRLGKLHGILVTGDVAFAGENEEYKQADDWLRELCKDTGCPPEQIRVISGNHDIKRGVIAKSLYLQKAHASLRQLATGKQWPMLDAEIQAFLGDQAVKDLLLAPLEDYNQFASKYFSSFSPKHPFWTWDIALNDHRTLRIRGLNSALISSKDDDEGSNKLVLGRLFSVLRREDGVEYMVLCHHPPQWLWDQDPVEGYLNTRARIQIFGHKHVQRIGEHKHEGFTSLRLHAGALNPDPDQAEYLPRYNCLSIRVVNQGGVEKMEAKVFARVWDAAGTRFDDAPKACHDSLIELESWSPPPAEAAFLSNASGGDPLKSVSDPLNVLANNPAAARALSAPRRLAYRFLALTYPLQQEAATRLNLLEESDKGLYDIDLFQRVFRRASERGKLSELWEQVEALHGTPGREPNPFST